MGLLGDEDAEDHRLLGMHSSAEAELNLSEGDTLSSSVTGSAIMAVSGPGVNGSWDSSYSTREDSARHPGIRGSGIELIRAASNDA